MANSLHTVRFSVKRNWTQQKHTKDQPKEFHVVASFQRAWGEHSMFLGYYDRRSPSRHITTSFQRSRSAAEALAASATTPARSHCAYTSEYQFRFCRYLTACHTSRRKARRIHGKRPAWLHHPPQWSIPLPPRRGKFAAVE